MTGHTPGPGTTVVDPTIGVEGTSTSICTVCNAPITVIIPALPGKVWSYDNPENLGIRLVDAQSLVVITPQNDGNRSYVDVGYENPGAITSGEWNLFFEPTTPLSVFDHTKKYVFETDMKISNLVPTSTYAESSAPWFMYLTLTDSTGTSGDNNHIFNVIYFDKLADGSMKLMIDDRSRTEKSACMPYDEWFNIKVIYSTYEASTDVNVEIAINGVTVYTGTKTAIGSDGLLKLDDNIVGFKLKFKSKSNFESFKISLDNSKFQEAHSDSLSITEVIAKGEELADGSHTEEKYYVTGIITEITDAQHGDMYIKDENGNLLYIDNTYSSDGKNRFDAITNKPVVSDIVTVYGVIGISDGEVHIKDGWIVNTRLHDPILADTITFDNTAKRTYFSTDKQVWEENGITVANTKNNSATNILDYSSPVRFYSGSSFAIEYITQMTQIVIKCNTSTFANSLMNSLALDNITVNVSDKTVTIQFVVPTSTFAIDALENQIRIDSIEVYR